MKKDSLIKWLSDIRMKANPEKLQSICIGDKTTIDSDKSVKLLGVTIEFMLNFNKHIYHMSKKASRHLKL